MPPKTLILDGLWQCLCPSMNANTVNRHLLILATTNSNPTPFGIPTTFTSSISTPKQRCRRSYFTRSSHKPDTYKKYHAEVDKSPTPFAAHAASHIVDESGNSPQGGERKHSREDWKDDSLSWRTPGVPEGLRAQSTPALETKIRNSADRLPNVQSVMEKLRVLIRDRHCRPQVWHYKALVQSNSDPRRGSPQLIRGLLAEMESNGIPMDSGTLHAALQAVAVHPDYLLRQDILRILRDRWLPLSPDGWHYVVAGLIREHQFELALDHIAHMERKDITVKSWLYSLLVYYLSEVDEFEQAMQLMGSRASQGHDISLDLWRHVLNTASIALHHDATCFVWDRMVKLGYLHPSRELCNQVLAVASNEGDTELAGSVAGFFAHNEIALEREEYERISETHAVAGDFFAAFETLCEMHKAGVSLQRTSTEAIRFHAMEGKSHPREVWAALKQLKAAGHEIPLGCAKMVFEMCEHGALNDPFDVDDGVAFYKELYTICPEKADTEVYNTLISMCRRAKNTESAMFIVKEMAAFGVIPDATTFEHLVLMCLESGNFESARMYFHDLLERELHPSEGARAEIRELCSGSDNEFAVQLRYHPEISEGLIRSPADEELAERGQPLFRRTETNPSRKMAAPALHVFGKDKQRDATRLDSQEIFLEKRRKYNKERRKRKRRSLAIARAQEEDDWMNYEPAGLISEEEPGSCSKTTSS